MNIVELENKIEDLNNRLTRLERIEKRRKIRLILKILFYVAIIIAFIIIGLKTYDYLNEKIIEPINSIKNNDVITRAKNLLEK